MMLVNCPQLQFFEWVLDRRLVSGRTSRSHDEGYCYGCFSRELNSGYLCNYLQWICMSYYLNFQQINYYPDINSVKLKQILKLHFKKVDSWYTISYINVRGLPQDFPEVGLHRLQSKHNLIVSVRNRSQYLNPAKEAHNPCLLSTYSKRKLHKSPRLRTRSLHQGGVSLWHEKKTRTLLFLICASTWNLSIVPHSYLSSITLRP